MKGEFGSAEDGLLARGRRQRRLIHPGRSYGSCHRRGCRDHWPESVQRGDGLGGHRWHSGDGGHSWHSRDGCHRACRCVGILELWVLLQLLVVLRVVPTNNIIITSVETFFSVGKLKTYPNAIPDHWILRAFCRLFSRSAGRRGEQGTPWFGSLIHEGLHHWIWQKWH